MPFSASTSPVRGPMPFTYCTSVVNCSGGMGFWIVPKRLRRYLCTPADPWVFVVAAVQSASPQGDSHAEGRDPLRHEPGGSLDLRSRRSLEPDPDDRQGLLPRGELRHPAA